MASAESAAIAATAATVATAAPVAEPAPLELDHARALRNAFAKAMEKTVQAASFEQLQKQNPTLIAPEDADYFKTTYQQFLRNVEKNTKDEFEMLLQDMNVVPVLNDLDNAIAKASTTAPARRFAGVADVPASIRAAAVAVKQEEKQQLLALIAEAKTRNAASRELLRCEAQQASGTQQALGRPSPLSQAAPVFEEQMPPAVLTQMADWLVTARPALLKDN